MITISVASLNHRLKAGLRMGLDALIVTVWLAIVIGLIFVKYGAVLVG